MEHSHTTVTQLLQLFDSSYPDQEEGTRYMRHLAFAQFVAVCGDCTLDAFSLAQCEAYRAALLGGFTPTTAEELSRLNQLPSRARQGLIAGFAPVTAASYLKMIRRPFRWWQVRQRTFCDYWSQLPAIKVPRKTVRVYNDDRLASLLTAAQRVEDGGLTAARVLVMATAGLRRAEAQQLCEQDIDFAAGTITVQPHAETGTTWAWCPKDRDCRTVPLVEQARDVLLARRKELSKEQPYLLLSADRCAYLMWMRSRGRLTNRMRKCPDENWRPFRRVRELAGTAGLSQKHLRSTFATNCLRDGIDLRSVQALMGHSDIATTEKYLAPDNGAMEKARSVGAAPLNRLQLARAGA